MKWEEVRKLYPNKFIRMEILKSHILNDKEYVEEVELVRIIEDEKEAMQEFMKCRNRQVVYSTKNEEFVIDVIRHVGLRIGI